jgi:hypothetical protein
MAIDILIYYLSVILEFILVLFVFFLCIAALGTLAYLIVEGL